VGARVVALAVMAARRDIGDGRTRWQGQRRWSGGVSEGVEGDGGSEGARGGGQVGSTSGWRHLGVVGVWW
jgi:hypothetical protein